MSVGPATVEYEALVSDGPPDVEALRRRHQRGLIRMVFTMVWDEGLARQVVTDLFETFPRDWPCCESSRLEPEVCLYRSAIRRVRELPARPGRRRSATGPGERFLAAIARLDVSEREAVVLNDIDREGALPADRILGMSQDEVGELLRRGQEQVRRDLRGEP
jgi:DNA-directed RNA polymerase specialized sigma24 family protein